MTPPAGQDAPDAATVLVVHAKNDAAFAREHLVEPLRAAEFRVFFGDDVLVGTSRFLEVNKVLDQGGPVVICGTARSAGSREVRQVVLAAQRRGRRVRVLGIQMEPDADLDHFTLDAEVAAWWEDREKAFTDLLAALRKYNSTGVGDGGPPHPGTPKQIFDPTTGGPAGIQGLRYVPALEFGARVEDAVRDRYPGADVRTPEHQGRPPFLEVEWSDEQGIRRRWPVGLAPDGLDDGLFEQFRAVHDGYVREDRSVESHIVINCKLVLEDLVGEVFREYGVRLWSLVDYERRWDPRRYLEYQAGRLAAEASYSPNLYVPQRFEPLEFRTPQPGGRQDVLGAILDWLDTETARLVLVHGDPGHGKSFLLRQLARQIPATLPHLVPILVDLRNHDKVNDLGVLLTQHLAAAQEKRIEPPAVRQMLARGQVALLVDGFDQLAQRVTRDEASDWLRAILSAVIGPAADRPADRAKVVLTSQEQHFTPDDQWRTILDGQVRLFPGSRLVRIVGFDSDQIRRFLVNVVALRGGPEQEAHARHVLIRKTKDLLDLSQNPQMLSVIARLPLEDLITLEDGTGQISAADIYRLLVDRWLAFTDNGARPTPGVSRSFDGQELRDAVDDLALAMWKNGGDAVDILRLGAAARHILTEMSDLKWGTNQGEHAFGAGSPLVRDGNRFSFVHPSVMEYLVAASVARQLGNGTSGTSRESLSQRTLPDLMVEFLCVCAAWEKLTTWVQQVLGDPTTPATARDNALRVAQKIELPVPGAQLAGQDLRGRDLSGLNLRFADLSRANLTGARLERTDLTGADLRRAELRGARLPGATLTNAKVSGSAWERAQLQGAIADGEVMADLQRAGATIDLMVLPTESQNVGRGPR